MRLKIGASIAITASLSACADRLGDECHPDDTECDCRVDGCDVGKCEPVDTVEWPNGYACVLLDWNSDIDCVIADGAMTPPDCACDKWHDCEIQATPSGETPSECPFWLSEHEQVADNCRDARVALQSCLLALGQSCRPISYAERRMSACAEPPSAEPEQETSLTVCRDEYLAHLAECNVPNFCTLPD